MISTLPALSSVAPDQLLMPLPSVVQALPFDSFNAMSTAVVMSSVFSGVDGFSCTTMYLSSIVLSNEVMRLWESQVSLRISTSTDLNKKIVLYYLLSLHFRI